MAQGIVFAALVALLIVVACLALLRLSLIRVESPLGRRRDGLRAGTKAPGWALPDGTATLRKVPHGSRKQMLVFADHAIASFPRLAASLASLAEPGEVSPDLEMVMFTRPGRETTAAVCSMLGLDLPLVAVDDHFYKRHNVWVVPHILILDPAGTVLVAGNVSEPHGVANMLRHAQLLTAGRS